MSRQSNQYPALPPDELLNARIEYYWHMGITDTKMVEYLQDDFKTARPISTKTIQRRRAELKLLSSAQQKATLTSVHPYISLVRERLPSVGARGIRSILIKEHSYKVSEELIAEYLRRTEPEQVRLRKGHKFIRKRFWAAGVMDVITMDQHDKFKRFGLFFHIGLDPFPGRILWLKVWWTVRRPPVVTKWYLDACRKQRGVSLVTQSDPGTENNGVANCHTEIRHRLDPSLIGTIQHQWKSDKMNVKPEAAWSIIRRFWSPGFEAILQRGVDCGMYNADDPLQSLVFRWLAIPWLQQELDLWTNRYNSTLRRADPRKLLPHGIPDLIDSKPHLFDAKDYRVLVDAELFNEMEARWAPPDDEVFQLTPPLFHQQAADFYKAIGSPTVSYNNFWVVYEDLLAEFYHVPHSADMAQILNAQRSIDPMAYGPEVALLPGLAELRNDRYWGGDQNSIYCGGLTAEQLQAAPLRLFVEFSDDEVDDQEEAGDGETL